MSAVLVLSTPKPSASQKFHGSYVHSLEYSQSSQAFQATTENSSRLGSPDEDKERGDKPQILGHESKQLSTISNYLNADPEETKVVMFELLSIKKNRETVSQSKIKWIFLLDFLAKKSALIYTLSSSIEYYSTSNHIKIEEYLDGLVQSNQVYVQSKSDSLSDQWIDYIASPASAPKLSLLDPNQTQHDNEDTLLDLLIECAAIIKVCKVLDVFFITTNDRKMTGIPLATHIRHLIDALAEDVKECLINIKDYYSKKPTSKYSRALYYQRKAYLWVLQFDNHRAILQTALALYLSLGAFDIDNFDRRLAVAFSLFPQLSPSYLGEDDHVGGEGHLNASLARPDNRSDISSISSMTLDPDNASTHSSYATARDTLESLSASMSSDERSSESPVYSNASSRTSDTDYGAPYYTRRAFSQMSGDFTGSWTGLNWSSGSLFSIDEMESKTVAGG